MYNIVLEQCWIRVHVGKSVHLLGLEVGTSPHAKEKKRKLYWKSGFLKSGPYIFPYFRNNPFCSAREMLLYPNAMECLAIDGIQQYTTLLLSPRIERGEWGPISSVPKTSTVPRIFQPLVLCFKSNIRKILRHRVTKIFDKKDPVLLKDTPKKFTTCTYRFYKFVKVIGHGRAMISIQCVSSCHYCQLVWHFIRVCLINNLYLFVFVFQKNKLKIIDKLIRCYIVRSIISLVEANTMDDERREMTLLLILQNFK